MSISRLIRVWLRIWLFLFVAGYVLEGTDVLAFRCGLYPQRSEHLRPDFEYNILDENNKGRVAIGDIDGDGKNDISVHTWGTSITWYKYPIWEKTVIVANDDIRGDEILLVDLDKDGDLDVVCSYNNQGRNVWWFENPLPSGDPESGNWKGYMIGSGHEEMKDIHVLDLDKDGKLDVVSRHHDRVYLYFQNTPTDWTQNILYIREREGMDVGDIDGDGDEDIILNGFWLENPGDPRNDIWPEYSIDSLWYQQTGGDWRDNACKVQVADINQDGRMDVVFSQSEKTGYPIVWYETTSPKGGDGAWTEHVIGYVDNCHSLQVADMDKDGDPDVVAGRLRDSPVLRLYIFYNEGRGNSWDQVLIDEGGSYSGKVGDIDNDGDIDFVSSRAWEAGPVYILRNLDSGLPIGPWERHVVDSSKPWRAIFILPGDINRDGFPDIITGGWWYQNPGTPGEIWMRHDIGEPLKNMAAVFDFDMDGDLDILGTEGQGSSPNDSFVWARNDGSGSFTILNNSQSGDGDFLQGVAVARFNSERPFEVALSWHQCDKGVQMLTVPSDPSSGIWTWRKIDNSSQDEQLSAGDIDRDGDIDLLQGTKWLRNDIGFWTQFELNGGDALPDRNRLADINGDGCLDAVVGYEAISTLGKLAWYQQPVSSPTDTWTEHVISNSVIGPMSLDVADMDSDGDLDVIVGEHNLDNSSGAMLYIFENVDGKGTSWKQHLVYMGDEHHDGVQVVDTDNDGDLDIISIGWGHDLVVLYENKANEARAGVPAKNNLEYLLSQRMSIRNWSDAPIEDEIMKAICKNSFASAFDLEGMELYISNFTGTYQYDKEHNQFVSKISGDLRYQLGLDIGETFVANASYIITLICNDEIEPSPLDANRKGGIIVQNLYILAIRHNLGGVCVGDGIYDEEVATNIQEHLGLAENLKPILLFPIGYLTAGQNYPTGNLQATTGNLPTPLESAMDVLELLQKSHQLSTEWENTSVSQQKLSNMLWATYGYSLLGTGHRTVPSAYGEYPFQIYVCNETGVYNYTAESHSLHQTSSIDKRSNVTRHANAPEYLEKAPVLLLFSWNSEVGTHNASDSDSGGRFINVGYGCCLQNLYLSATLWNISISSPFHTYNYDALRTDLSDLPLPNIYPMYLIGLGEAYDDKENPSIGTSVRVPSDEVQPNQKVKVAVNVTDAGSGVKNVTLSYTTDNCTSWINIPMNYNTTTGLYEAIIPEQPIGTLVKYEITAFDKASNKSVENNSGQYFVYTVIPEFTATMFLLILLFSTTVIFTKKIAKNKKKTNNQHPRRTNTRLENPTIPPQTRNKNVKIP